MNTIRRLASKFKLSNKLSDEDRKWLASQMPDGHTEFWIYAHKEFPDENFETPMYNLEISDNFVDARRLFNEFIDEGWDMVYMYWGNEERAFSDTDALATHYSDSYREWRRR